MLKRILTVAFVCSFPLVAAAGAQEVKTSGGVACDTPEQVKQIVTAEDKEAALGELINVPGPPPCVRAVFAYTETGKAELVQVPEGTARIVEVVLVAFSLDGVTMMPSKPVTLYLPFLVETVAARI